MDEDLIVLGAQADTPAAGGEDSHAAANVLEVETTEGTETGATPGNEQDELAGDAPKPNAPKGEAEDDGEPEKPKKRSGIQRMQDKISRLEAELSDSRRAAPAAGADRKALIEKEIGAPPKEADFDDFVAFEDAKAEYRIAKALADQRLKDQETANTSRQARVQEEMIEAFEDQKDAAREKIADFDKVLASAADRKIEKHVSELVLESEKGALLAYYLAKTPGKLEELNRMSPLKAARAVGALEHRLTLAKPKTATTAPAPAKPVSGSAKPASPDSDLDAWLAKKYG
ncbi:hypothetical protein [Methylobacterium brachythecii]|uniref:Uncharacterized protein n=1 Tax=Methylobacterium brachythecii TaxID=1176177 RepID=A0A7W6F930_9HYPH|nr:hypothetical protein [Methylobacterium brachythecii]MBB3905122.1 hypothetical protein [Methylobacterium brachythecii]GLS44370.1 hypothetical protein GCM10007884_23580 [Methylobacterium brachythecii]